MILSFLNTKRGDFDCSKGNLSLSLQKNLWDYTHLKIFLSVQYKEW